MTIQLFAFDTPNGRKVSIALEEMGLPYEIHVVDIMAGDQMKPEFLAISPNNKIPAIIDPDGPDGQAISIFESGAILIYLAEKTGKFLPTDRRSRTAVMEWLMFQVGGLGPMPGQVHHFMGLTSEEDRRYGLARFTAETRRLYGVVDRRLANHNYIAGDLSIADFALLSWVTRHQKHRIDLKDFVHVQRWFQMLMARPAVVRGLEVALRN